MPKLIIKREVPPRFMRQAILFWVLGLLPVALLAGFLTGNLISQLRHSSFKSGQAPLLPLAPAALPTKLSTHQRPLLPLPILSKQPSDTLPNKQLDPTDSALIPTPKDVPESRPEVTPLAQPQPAEQKKHSKPVQKAAEPTKTTKPSAVVINHPNTKNQQNNRNRPTITPSTTYKSVKSPQTVSESPRPSRSVKRPTTESSASKLAKPQAGAQPERETHDDYRLLEQSLGISLQ